MPIGKIATKRGRYPAVTFTVPASFLTEIKWKTGRDAPRFTMEFQDPDLVHLRLVEEGGGTFSRDSAKDWFTLQTTGPVAAAVVGRFGHFGRIQTEFVWADNDLILQVPANPKPHRLQKPAKRRGQKPDLTAKSAPERAAVPEPPISPQPDLGRPKRDLDPASADWITAAIGETVSPADVRAVKRAIDYVERHTPYQLKKHAADRSWVFDAERIE